MRSPAAYAIARPQVCPLRADFEYKCNTLRRFPVDLPRGEGGPPHMPRAMLMAATRYVRLFAIAWGPAATHGRAWLCHRPLQLSASQQ